MPELRRHRLADHDPAGRERPLDDDGVRVGDVPREQGGPEARLDPARRREVLDGDRHAVQRAQRLAGQHGRLGAARVPARLVRGDGAERVQRGIEPVDPVEERIEHLDRRDLPRPDGVGQAGRVAQVQLGHARPPRRRPSRIPRQRRAGIGDRQPVRRRDERDVELARHELVEPPDVGLHVRQARPGQRELGEHGRHVGQVEGHRLLRQLPAVLELVPVVVGEALPGEQHAP